MDNIANDEIDLDALDAEHNKMLEQYKNAPAASVNEKPDELLIPDWLFDKTKKDNNDVPLLVSKPFPQSMIPLNSGYTGAWQIGDPPRQWARSLTEMPSDLPTHEELLNEYDSEMSKYDNEEDPRGSVHKKNHYTNNPKRNNGKTDHWQAHAWADDSEEDINDLFNKLNGGKSHSKMYDNDTMDDFVDFGEDGDGLNPWGNFIDEPTKKTAVNGDKKLHLFMAQLQEKGDEMAVTIDKLSGDVGEISRDVGEILPLVSDTNEDLRELKSDMSKITNRVVKMEASLRKLDISVSNLSNMMEIIVKHFTDADLT